ncbi:MAG TPA: ABC transporter ATP-binding protein [Candidatus Binatia bacterium]|nr:ABC transporter ATP-binding protein [Candidatus Binatia bacterium]
MAENLLELHDIQVRHGDQTVLKICRLEISPGEVLALLGPNGAGKTTLLQVMGMLRVPNEGEIYFRGEKVARPNVLTIRRRIATVFQEPLLLNATVRANAALGLRLRGVKQDEIDSRLQPWLERLGIAALAARSARALSGGEAQRANLARALVLEPELVLLDEPFSALDPVSREALLRDFYRIVKETRMTTVFVTHDRQEAFALAERVGVMKQGRLLQIGPREALFLRPNSAAVAEIVGFENRVAATVHDVDGDDATLVVGEITLRVKGRFPSGSRVVACVRGEDISLGAVGCESKRLNCLMGKITELLPGVLRHRFAINCGGVALVALLDRKESQAMALERGSEVTACFDAETVHVIADEGLY